MRINEVHFDSGPPVESYGPGFFRVAGLIHRGPLALVPGGVVEWSGLPDIAPFLAAAARIDVLFLGMGSEIASVPAALRVALEEAGIGVEVMATPPACRTYNVLVSEGRRIAAGLLPIAP